MNFKQCLIAVTSIGALGLASLVSAAEKPNILFIFSDDHATEAISAYGGRLSKIAPTPNIDRLAKEGALFKSSYCSNSICGPSRAAILTGKHSHINGYQDNENSRFDGTQTTFPKLMQKAGYQTAIIGKWHLKTTPQGFDHWEVLPGQGSYYNPDFLVAPDRKKVRTTGHCSDIITDKTLKWLETKRDKSKPFILMCLHKAPHRSWSPADRHLKSFDGIDLPIPDSLFDDYKNRSSSLAKNKMSIKNHLFWGNDMKFHGKNLFPKYFASGTNDAEYSRMNPEQKKLWDDFYEPRNKQFIEEMKAGKLSDKEITEWKFQRYLKNYLRTVQGVDDSVGRLLDYLESSGLDKNTIVIYSSDQGFYLGEHGWYDKRWMFEESLEMPFLIRWPGVVKAGARPSAMIQNIDYAPTFLEVAGIDIPSTIQGKSLLPVLKPDSDDTPFRDTIYYRYTGESTHSVARHDGVRGRRYKLIRFPNTDEWNLFDLEKDPQEMQSFHADPAYKEVLVDMKSLYAKTRSKYEVYPTTIPAYRKNAKWWMKRFNKSKQQAKTGGHKLLFIGDSITQGWEDAGKDAYKKYFKPRKVLNLGIGADRTQHVLYRLQMGALPADDAAKVAVVLIGTNNAKGNIQTPHRTAKGIEHILELLRDRKPGMDIILVSIFPRGANALDPKRIHNETVNKALITLAANDSKIHLMDISDQLIQPDQTISTDIMPDLLHLSPKGYEIWAKALDAKLDALGLEK